MTSLALAEEIAVQIYGEMASAAATDAITFDDEEEAYIKQALSDAVLEALLLAAERPKDTTKETYGDDH